MATCSQCGLDKVESDFHQVGRGVEVRADCKKCRNETMKRYRKPEGLVCPKCQSWCEATKTGSCRRCNESIGIRECSRCGDILAISLDFYGREPYCKLCR